MTGSIFVAPLKSDQLLQVTSLLLIHLANPFPKIDAHCAPAYRQCLFSFFTESISAHVSSSQLLSMLLAAINLFADIDPIWRRSHGDFNSGNRSYLKDLHQTGKFLFRNCTKGLTHIEALE